MGQKLKFIFVVVVVVCVCVCVCVKRPKRATVKNLVLVGLTHDFGAKIELFSVRLFCLKTIKKDVWGKFRLLQRAIVKSLKLGVAILDFSKAINPWFGVKNLDLFRFFCVKRIRKDVLGKFINTCEGKTTTTNQWGSAGSLVDPDQ